MRALALRGIAFAFTALALQSSLAQWWNPQDRTPPARRGTPDEPKVVYNQAMFNAARNAANGAMWNDDFKKLERMHEEFVRERLRTNDGRWMAEAVQAGLDGAFHAADERLLKTLFERWEKALPESRLLPVAKAVMWQRLAWRARGNAGASQVPGEGMQVFQERLRMAGAALRESEATGKDSPIWYWVALIVAGGSGVPGSEFDALFNEAVTRYPTYQPLYNTRMNYLLPQWGGSYKAVDRFVADSVSRTSASEGQSYYALLYVDVATKHPGDFFGETGVSWPRMKASFDDLLARHPDARNKELYATFACRARDRDTTARILTELGEAAKLGYGSPGVSTESCRRFALSQA